MKTMNTLPKETSVPMHRESGFTMVELMVGVLVGLVAIVIMFQVFMVSEGQKRTTTGAGDAQQSGLVSLFQMERDIRMSGFGLNLPGLLGCITNGRNEQAGVTFSLPLAPVTITNGAGGAPDTITVMYGSSDNISSPERLRAAVAASTDQYVIGNRYGFNVGDVLVVGETGKNCTMSQISSLPGTANIAHASASYVDVYGQAQITKFNGAPATFPGYGAWVKATNAGGRLFNLGNTPTITTYAVQNNALVAIDATAPATPPIVIADGIVQLQAQYGYDGNGDGKITAPTDVALLNPTGADQWADSLPAGMTAQQWSRITAVRLAVVARSVTPEKPGTSGTCVTTMVGPRWFARNPTTAYNIDVSFTGANWGCYRYRVFEVTVPIRNIAWFPDETL